MVARVGLYNLGVFLASRRCCVLHFDAGWNAVLREPTRRAMDAAEREFGSTVRFGEVDIDQDPELARSIDLGNIPLVAYYRDGSLVAGLIGAGQHVPERTRRLLRGDPIGYKDGTGTFGPPRARAQQ